MSGTGDMADADRDVWEEILRCPSCATESTVSLAQRAGEDKPTVVSEPSDFNVVATEYGPAFHCKRCNRPAMP